eukprot:TRINITY_DN64_c0_g1_i1.p1 TRINITY_DN64_c0_g1~~TRINITY_DN64_c0_g1_i1.p1  ORF type:complete len:357 (-),score=101.81 TRINITY_DN64_c0_g1_i1:41-1111(-)
MEGDFEKFHAFDPKDKTWWERREMGSPDDPYNQIPQIEEGSDIHKEYIQIAEDAIEHCYKESCTEEGWTANGETNGIKISYKDLPDSPIRCFKGVGVIKATAEVLRLHLVQIDLRQFWDPMFLGGAYKLQITKDYRVVYYSFSAPWPVTSRDFVTVAGEFMEEDGSVVSAVNSIQRDDMPDKEGFVRGHLSPTGFVVKPLANAEDGTPRCEVTYIIQIDPSGWIPTWVVNLVNADQPNCINKLEDIVRLTENLIEHMILKLFALSDDQWKAAEIKNIITGVLAADQGKPEMLWDPLRYLITGKRTGDASITVVMEEQGKQACLQKLWNGILPYAKSIASKEVFEAATKLGLTGQQI